jgi:hypothetical protein
MAKNAYAKEEEKLLEVMEEGFQNENPNWAAIAREHDVDYQKLMRRVNGGQSKMDRKGSNRLLSDAQEFTLIGYIRRLDDLGVGARKIDIEREVRLMLKRSHHGDGPPRQLGKHWADRWIADHPDLFRVKQKSIEEARKQSHDPDNIRKWLQKFQATRIKYSILDDDLWNFDESGFRIGIGDDQYIITFHPDLKTFVGSSTNRESVTVTETVSAAGQAIPPFAILQVLLTSISLIVH